MSPAAPASTLPRRDGAAQAKTVPEILTAARALLVRDGLHKGSMYPNSVPNSFDGTDRVRYEPGMPICLLAACRIVDTGNPRSGVSRAAEDALQETLQHRTGKPLGVGPWQDRLDCTLDDVLDLIDETIDRYHQQHPAESSGA